MNPLVIVLLIVLFLVMAATVGYFIWLRRHIPVPPIPSPPVTPPTPTPPFSGPAYANPIWNQSQSAYPLPGFSVDTKYDNLATSAPACATAIQSEAQKANDGSVVGWTWISTPTQPNQCRAVTSGNLPANFCITQLPSPQQSYMGNTALSYYNAVPCQQSPQR